MAYGYAPRLPLTLDPDDGAFKNLKTIKEVVKQNFKMLLLTIPGERMMDPLFGVGIKKYIYEQNLEETYGEMTSEIYSQVAKYLPFIEITDIIVGPNKGEFQDPHIINISIFYRILPLDVNDILSIDEVTSS